MVSTDSLLDVFAARFAAMAATVAVSGTLCNPVPVSNLTKPLSSAIASVA